MKRNDDLGDESAPHLLFSFGGGGSKYCKLDISQGHKEEEPEDQLGPVWGVAWPPGALMEPTPLALASRGRCGHRARRTVADTHV